MKPAVSPLLIGLFVSIGLVAAILVALSLRRPVIDTYAPTPPAPAEVVDTVVGPVQYTVDARSPDRWVFFDFSRGSVVESPGPLDWDLAFRRFRIIVNGGRGFAGTGAIADLGDVPFESNEAMPDTGWVETEVRSDSSNPAVARWYSYGWSSHILRPRPNVYAVRTADGRHARMRMISYYCPGAIPGCLTFAYVYLGSGTD